MNAPLLEICLRDLFSDMDELNKKYPENTVKSILRVRDMYLWVVKYPFKRDSDFVKEECGRYKVSRPTAYADLNLIKALLPDLSKSSREFNEWRFTEMILKTYEIAKDKKDVRTMERAASAYAKYMNLDKYEEQKIDLSQIVPPPLIPTEDPSVLGFKMIPDRRNYIKKITDKYSKDMPDILDIKEEQVEIDAYLNGYGIQSDDDVVIVDRNVNDNDVE